MGFGIVQGKPRGPCVYKDCACLGFTSYLPEQKEPAGLTVLGFGLVAALVVIILWLVGSR